MREPALLLSPRWMKLLRDGRSEAGRVLAMIAAIAVSLVGIAAVLGALAILKREIAANYLGTSPADITLVLPAGVDEHVLAEVRARPEVANAEPRDAVLARARVGEEWRPLLIFAVDDFERMRLNTFRSEMGPVTPPPGTMLLERTATGMLETALHGEVRVRTPHGERTLVVSGVVHDPGLAPAWQERMGYAYITTTTLELLGEGSELHELRIALEQRGLERAAVVDAATAIARSLVDGGHAVEEVRVPPPGRHPHQLQMMTILVMMAIFAAMALVLSAVLVATSLAAMLARQVREIGVMKTIGAGAGQIGALYAVLIAAIGVVSVVIAWPLGVLGARSFAEAVARMVNFEIGSDAIPLAVLGVISISGVIVPLVAAALPIARAVRVTVRASLDQHGVTAGGVAAATSLPLPVRNAVRRPARLVLTLALLASGGAMFVTALDVERGWSSMVGKFHRERSYDLELRFSSPQPLGVAQALRGVAGVERVEAWGYAPASIVRRGDFDVTAGYPDGRHAVFSVHAPPPETTLIALPVLEGRWLERGDADVVVLNHSARAQLPDVSLGGTVRLAIEGRMTTWTLVGVVEEVGAGPVAYVSDRAFATATGNEGKARMLRVATAGEDAPARAAALRAVEEALASARIAVEQGLALEEHKNAVGEHIAILVNALIAMAAIFGLVGVLGLGSAMSVSVVERTRELGVMKAIGATPTRIVRMILLEALFIAAVSFLVALGVALPLTAVVGGLVGRLGFMAPLPVILSPVAAGIWLVASLVVSVVATLVPARRAASLTVRDAIAHL